MSAPIVAFVGHSESGKTGYLEKLLPELTGRGFKIATVKHVPQHFHCDNPQKDTERHLAAGASATVACAADTIVITKPVPASASLEDISQILGDEYDIVIAEGFKQSGIPKIEVWRQGIGQPLEQLTSRVAVVTSDKYPGTAPRLFSLEDITGMADFLEKSYITPKRQRISLHINGEEVGLSAFPREFIGNVVDAMITSLKGAPPARWLEISMRNDKETPS